MQSPLLSICIATYMRGAFLGETMDALLAQWQSGVELVVVDGASTDNTAELMAHYVRLHPHIVYRRELANSGVDADFDKAVQYAGGHYCWLMSDDDLPAPGAVTRILQALQPQDIDLLVLNTEVRDKTLTRRLRERRLPVEADREYGAGDAQRLFCDTCMHLSFIAATVVRRAFWLARERRRYFGSLFIHIGVLFQAPAVSRARLLAQPAVVMRDGNAMWTPRTFEIWMSRWPDLVWSFDHFSQEARGSVTPRRPAHSAKMLLWLRALGVFGAPARVSLAAQGCGMGLRAAALVIAALPARPINAAVALYCHFSRDASTAMKLYALVNAPCVSGLALWLGRRHGVVRDAA